jgi:hypothetical protein
MAVEHEVEDISCLTLLLEDTAGLVPHLPA